MTKVTKSEVKRTVSGCRWMLFGLIAIVGCVAAMMVWAKTTSPPSYPSVVLQRVPGGGIEPEAVLGRDGVLRMIYFEGNPAAGNIEYVTRKPGARSFSAPIRVNSQPGSALAIGAVRGPQMALGGDGRAYVIWFGSAHARPRGPAGKTPVLFSRLDDKGAFSPQRNLMKWTQGLDGGLSIAADQRGDVYAVWHAQGAEPGEAHRRVYLAVSRDQGDAFSREVPISPASLGACGCCGMKAFVDHEGTLFILYRAAAEGVHRDMTLLVSTNRGLSFGVHDLSRWKLDACPMSTAALAEGGGSVLAAWEKAGQVYFDEINPRTLAIDPALAAPGVATSRKHPVVAENAKGQVLFAWTEGTAWMKGGSVAWQLFSARGEPMGAEGHAPALPVWGLLSVVAGSNGNFTLMY